MAKDYILLNKNFFKRNDVRILESLPDGKKYLLFYIQLLIEASKNDGRLLFNMDIPYTESMLAAITDTDESTVGEAIKCLKSLGFIRVLENGTIFISEAMNTDYSTSKDD